VFVRTLGGIFISSLAVQGLSKRFGATEVLRGISFEVADGEFCILLGPSGCGKSTVLRLIAGLETPTAGDILIADSKIDHLQPRERDVAFVFQNYALYPHMTVFQNLAFSLRLRRARSAEIEAKVRETARLLEIEDLLERRPQALSGGQRQRVALGRAIVRKPKIFLFDEPLSNLDAALRSTMRLELARLHRKLGATIVYVTHDQAEALTLGDRVIVLDRGTIQQVGPPSEIYHRPRNLMVASFVGSPKMNLLAGTFTSGTAAFQCGKLCIELRSIPGKSLPRIGDGPLTLGIRPEDLQPTSAERAWLSGDIEIIEDLGSDRYIHLRCDGAELVARSGTDSDLKPGMRIGLQAAPGRLHFFHNGERMEP
jgi:ABC-type sugar transport system ATPase subunit